MYKQYHFQENKSFPIFSKINPQSISKNIKFAIRKAELEFTKIISISEEEDKITYNNTFLAYEESLDPLNSAWGLFSHLESVCNTSELRKEYNKVLPIVTEFYAQIPLNFKLWKALKASEKILKRKKLSLIQKRHINETISDFKEEGSNLNEPKKRELKKIQSEIAKLTQKYSENCLDSKNSWEHITNDRSSLKGIPESLLNAAKTKTHENEIKKKEEWRFTLDATNYIPILQYADNSTLRKKIWTAYQLVGREKPFDNQILIKKILILREKYAKILGKKNYADYKTKRRMVKNSKTAIGFVESLHEKVKPAFNSEFEKLNTYKKTKEIDLNENLNPWDVAYYINKYKNDFYNFDEEELRPYFSINNVLNGLFLISKKLFNLEIKEIESIYIEKNDENLDIDNDLNPNNLPEVWDKEVKIYQVFDKKNDTTIGYFYTDWYPRPSKRGGAWMNFLDRSINKSNLPKLGIICANLTAPQEDKPAQLSHYEVETIFHEFGHLLHHICGEVEIPSLDGINVAWDFVELPSQLMENWCWEKESLDLFAKHYLDKSSIPEKLFQKMRETKNHFKAIATMRQLSLAKLDLDLHADWSDNQNMHIEKYLSIRLKNYQFKFDILPTTIVCNFSHIFGSSSGYAAGYYSYKWSEVLDADVFTKFLDKGILCSKTGQSFREKILAKGNSKDADTLFEDFMGRKPSLTSLLKRDGLYG